MWTTAIISWPISKLLDYLLGSEHTVSMEACSMQFLSGWVAPLQVSEIHFHRCAALIRSVCWLYCSYGIVSSTVMLYPHTVKQPGMNVIDGDVVAGSVQARPAQSLGRSAQ